MEEIFYRYNPWWEEKPAFPGIIDRPGPLGKLKKHLPSKTVTFLTGMRRVGKSTLLKILIKHLIGERNVSPRQIFYVSLDDYLLSKKSILEIIEEYRKIQRLSYKDHVFLFLDEVAYKSEFALQLKNVHDGQNAKIFASSSSASVLRMKKSHLTGRSVTVELLPLDFREYLAFRRIKIGKADRPLLEKHFDDFLQRGGMPEYVIEGDTEHIRDLVDDIIVKDICTLHGIRNPGVLKDFFLLLMERAGKPASINKLARILKISPDTARRYMEMFADTYLIDLVPRYGKTNQRLLSPKKVYAADTGIRALFTGPRDLGSLFENYVYLRIRHRNPRYVYENGTEIDFLTDDKTLIEAKYNSTLTSKQQDLFDRLSASRKVIVTGIHDLETLLGTP